MEGNDRIILKSWAELAMVVTIELRAQAAEGQPVDDSRFAFLLSLTICAGAAGSVEALLAFVFDDELDVGDVCEFWSLLHDATTLSEEDAAKIAEQRTAIEGEPKNLEEQAISLIGTDIYTKLIKGYTEKQWGRSCTELPAFIIKRLPVRYTFDNNYFNDRYQGIPIGGYNVLIQALLDGIEVRTGVDYNEHRDEYRKLAKTVMYTGPIDAYFDYKLGQLEYRGLRFETERLEEENHQGVAVMNYTDRETPYTRSIEHKHFEFGTQPVTYVTKEYPADWHPGEEAYYPVNDSKNSELYNQYAALAAKEKHVIFGGRLAEYKYYDMDDVIASALQAVAAQKE